MKDNLVRRLKDNIILNTLNLLDAKKEDIKTITVCSDQIIKDIRVLTKHFGDFVLKRSLKPLDLYSVLKQFISGNEGYDVLLPLLYNAVLNFKK